MLSTGPVSEKEWRLDDTIAKKKARVDNRFGDCLTMLMDETKIVQKLIEHDQRFDQLVTKDDFAAFRNETSTTQDEMLKILRRLDQERIFTTKWVQRIESEVEEHRAEIAKIKEALEIR